MPTPVALPSKQKPPSSIALRRAFHATAGVAAFAALGLSLSLRPQILDLWLLVLVVYAVALWWRPQIFLFVLPAALPFASLAQWTGALYVEEWDLLALLGAAVLYARWVISPPQPRRRQHSLGMLLLGLMTLSYLIAMWRGLIPLQAFYAGDLSGYHTHWNSLRIAKGFFYAALYWPLLNIYLCRDEGHTKIFGAGMAACLGFISLFCVWERMAFPGLLNLTSDYRSTALFWEMHVGGAALDGFCALTLPFALWALLRTKQNWLSAVAVLLFGLASYAIFTSFSRGLYGAYAVTMALVLWRHARSATTPRNWAGVAAALCAALPLIFVFLTSGYRGLLASTGVLIGAVGASVAWRTLRPAPFALSLTSGVVFLLIASAIYALFPKGAYIAYAVCALTGAFSYAAYRAGQRRVAALLPGLWVALSASALFVAYHWGGRPALLDMSIAVILALALGALNAVKPQPLLPDTRDTWLSIAMVLVFVGLAAVSAHSFYVAERFSTVTEDLRGRTEHWRIGLRGMSGYDDWLLGKGLGRFPATYFWNIPDNERPGVHRVGEIAPGNASLSMSSPHHVLGYGEVYRVGQEISRAAVPPFRISLDARADRKTPLAIELCQKHLLYNGACYRADIKVEARPDEWQHFEMPFVGKFNSEALYAPKLRFFSFGMLASGQSLQLDNVQIIDGRGEALLRNGDFSAGTDYWFFTSDRHHLPWHMKSLWLNYLFDQGWLGVLAFTMVFAGAVGRLMFTRARSHELAPYILAALCAFFIVGLFDSLVDVPRLTFLFFVLLFVALFIDAPSKTHA